MASRSQLEVLSVKLLSGATGSTTSDPLDKGPYNNVTIRLSGLGSSTNTATVQIQGTIDDPEDANAYWFAVPYRTPSSDTSATTDVTLTDNTDKIFYLDPKFVRAVRIKVTANASHIPVEALVVAIF